MVSAWWCLLWPRILPGSFACRHSEAGRSRALGAGNSAFNIDIHLGLSVPSDAMPVARKKPKKPATLPRRADFGYVNFLTALRQISDPVSIRRPLVSR